MLRVLVLLAFALSLTGDTWVFTGCGSDADCESRETPFAVWYNFITGVR